MFLFDAHVHTAESSKCAKWSGAEAAEAYAAKGYSGIIVTDHFVNGNTRADRTAPWEEQVAVAMAGYKAAKARGDEIGLKVFFGFESANDGAEFLTYGLDEEWLLKHPESAQLPMKEYLALVRSEGAFVVHAHPFRRSRHPRCMHLFPGGVDAVEIVNFGNLDVDNHLAKVYAEAYGLPMTAGSDSHNFGDIRDFVVGTEADHSVVAEDTVAEGRQLRKGVIVIPADRRPGHISTGHYQAVGHLQTVVISKEKVLQGGIGKHDSHLGVAGRHRGRQERASPRMYSM